MPATTTAVDVASTLYDKVLLELQEENRLLRDDVYNDRRVELTGRGGTPVYSSGHLDKAFGGGPRSMLTSLSFHTSLPIPIRDALFCLELRVGGCLKMTVVAARNSCLVDRVHAGNGYFVRQNTKAGLQCILMGHFNNLSDEQYEEGLIAEGNDVLFDLGVLLDSSSSISFTDAAFMDSRSIDLKFGNPIVRPPGVLASTVTEADTLAIADSVAKAKFDFLPTPFSAPQLMLYDNFVTSAFLRLVETYGRAPHEIVDPCTVGVLCCMMVDVAAPHNMLSDFLADGNTAATSLSSKQLRKTLEAHLRIFGKVLWFQKSLLGEWQM